MVLIDFAGEATLFTMDTLYRSGENGLVGKMTPDEIRTVILGMSALIALNIFATIVFELGKMEVLKEIAEGAARDLVMFKALAQIEKDSETVADEMIEDIVNQWRGNFRSAFGSADKLGIGQYETKDRVKPDLKPARSFSIWPLLRKWKLPNPVPLYEPEQVPVEARVNMGCHRTMKKLDWLVVLGVFYSSIALAQSPTGTSNHIHTRSMWTQGVSCRTRPATSNCFAVRRRMWTRSSRAQGPVTAGSRSQRSASW